MLDNLEFNFTLLSIMFVYFIGQVAEQICLEEIDTEWKHHLFEFILFYLSLSYLTLFPDSPFDLFGLYD